MSPMDDQGKARQDAAEIAGEIAEGLVLELHESYADGCDPRLVETVAQVMGVEVEDFEYPDEVWLEAERLVYLAIRRILLPTLPEDPAEDSHGARPVYDYTPPFSEGRPK